MSQQEEDIEPQSDKIKELSLFEKLSNFVDKMFQSAIVSLPRVVITFGAGHPFDLVKTRMQANPNIISGVLLSKNIFEKTGIKGFYTAGTTNFARNIIKESYRGSLQGGWSNFYQNHFLQNADYAQQKLVASLSMSFCDTIILCPWERIKVWLMTKGKGRKFPDFFRENGKFKSFLIEKPNISELPIVPDLFKGFTVSLTRSIISWSTYIVPEAIIREKIIQFSPRIDEKEEYPDIPLPEAATIGVLGGIINGICSLPFDTIKTNVQMDGAKNKAHLKEMYNVGKNLVFKHGFSKGLYPGFITKLIHYSIVGMITAPVVQRVDKIWGVKRPGM